MSERSRDGGEDSNVFTSAASSARLRGTSDSLSFMEAMIQVYKE